jgi:hypothetical protein
MMQELQSLLENQKTPAPMELGQTTQELPMKQVCQIRPVLKSLVGQQKLVLTMQGLQSLLEDWMEPALMKQGLKRLEQMKVEVLDQSLP